MAEPTFLYLVSCSQQSPLHPCATACEASSRMKPAQVPKNAKGGVLVREAEIRAAFEFLDVEGKGVINASILRKRLGAFHRNMSASEARMLMNNKTEMTLEDLKEVLLENEVTNFDPVAEAFKVYDPSCTGFVDAEVLRNVFDNLGFGRISDEDLLMLVEAADSDGDGRVSIEDFRGISDFSGKEERAPSDDNTKNNGIIQAQN